MEWFGLKGTLKIITFHPTCHGQHHFPPDQVTESPIQSGFELFPGMTSSSVVLHSPVDFAQVSERAGVRMGLNNPKQN